MTPITVADLINKAYQNLDVAQRANATRRPGDVPVFAQAARAEVNGVRITCCIETAQGRSVHRRKHYRTAFYMDGLRVAQRVVRSYLNSQETIESEI